MDFASLAKVACASDAAAEVLKKHMRAARTELTRLKLTKKKKPPAATHARRTQPETATDAPPQPPLFSAQAPALSRTGNTQTTTGAPPPPPPSSGVGGSGAPVPLQPDSPRGSVPTPTIPRDPPKSNTKGRAKSKRIESALELHPKRKNKCSFCGSFDHNAASCKERLV